MKNKEGQCCETNQIEEVDDHDMGVLSRISNDEGYFKNFFQAFYRMFIFLHDINTCITLDMSIDCGTCTSECVISYMKYTIFELTGFPI